ncbi:MAG TPA: HEPN domain-containing protein [Candidatus Sulfotelmatobacter sp.]|nr:HEPN domain-containing protein [Candidatus Sulfotelmatobacter sp.]
MDVEYRNAWLLSADHELDAAQLLFEQGGYIEVVAYHIHQGLERCLKGFLTSHGAALPAVHDLGELLRRAASLEPELLRFVEDVGPLTGFFVETLEDELEIPAWTRDEVRHALEIAWRVRQRLSVLLPAGGDA